MKDLPSNFSEVTCRKLSKRLSLFRESAFKSEEKKASVSWSTPVKSMWVILASAAKVVNAY